LRELICDTSVLSTLYQAGLLGVLERLGCVVTIPRAVERELLAGRDAGYNVPDATDFEWIGIREPRATPSLPEAENLGPGESAVLWLAIETPDSVAVLDDNAAREVAGQLGLPFTGTLGLLLDAKRLGLIQALGPALDELERCRFHVSHRVREIILRAAGE
jgi:predicted nucleic acid-binding protein